MESNQRFYWRRAAEEYYAAERAVTPAARSRRRQLAELYVRRLRESGIDEFVMPEAPPATMMLNTDMRRLSETLVEWPLPRRRCQPPPLVASNDAAEERAAV